MKINQKGIAEVALLGYVVIGLILFFVPNPVSSAVGVGVRPNKTVQKEERYDRVELLKDEKGNPVLAADGAFLARRQGGLNTSDTDKVQRVGFLEQLRSLPVLFLVLVILGGLFPPLGIALLAVWKRGRTAIRKAFGEKEALMTDTKKIIIGLERAFATVPLTLAGTNLPGEINRADLATKIVEEMKYELGEYYNDSTKALVKSVKS